MKITAIKKQKKYNRFNIFIDGKFAFALSEAVLPQLNLYVDKEIGDKDLSEIKAKIFFFEAEEALINYLKYRPRTEKEIVSKLRQKGYQSSIISQLIEKYQKIGYINDNDFAESYLLDLISHHPQGKYLLSNKLKSKGISKEVIALLIEKYVTTEKETEMAEQALNQQKSRFKKYATKEIYKKALAFLQRKGFSYLIAKNSVDRFILAENFSE
ncbi:MAG: RecX family transcriptional regulator [Candidatus Cloacimonetes bacterium]|nr:RecX family transcriptional regulator [Candidatus Cloacimonadota bacterium]